MCVFMFACVRLINHVYILFRATCSLAEKVFVSILYVLWTFPMQDSESAKIFRILLTFLLEQLNCMLEKKIHRSWFGPYWSVTDGGALFGAVQLLLGRECFCLLHFWPWPVLPSLYNLDSCKSSLLPILMSSLAWTPDQHTPPPVRSLTSSHSRPRLHR